MFHRGHLEAIKQSKSLGDTLIIGIISDTDCASYKRNPIINENDRCEIINSIKYVDNIIFPAPLLITNSFLEDYNIDLVVHGFSDDNDFERQKEFFKVCIDNNKFKRINYYSKISTTDIINKIKDNYDAIVITRGGGSFEDLFGFSQPELIEVIHNFNQPVISAIGHQVDTSLLDLVSDRCCPTPSLAAQYIIDINKKFINELEEIRDDIKDELMGLYNKQNRGLNTCTERLNKIILSFDRIQHSYQSELLNQLNTYAFKLKELDLKLSSLVNNTSANDKNNTILIKNNKNVIHKDVTKFIKRLEGTDDFIIDWGKNKIKISSYKFKLL